MEKIKKKSENITPKRFNSSTVFRVFARYLFENEIEVRCEQLIQQKVADSNTTSQSLTLTFPIGGQKSGGGHDCLAEEKQIRDPPWLGGGGTNPSFELGRKFYGRNIFMRFSRLQVGHPSFRNIPLFLKKNHFSQNYSILLSGLQMFEKSP